MFDYITQTLMMPITHARSVNVLSASKKWMEIIVCIVPRTSLSITRKMNEKPCVKLLLTRRVNLECNDFHTHDVFNNMLNKIYNRNIQTLRQVISTAYTCHTFTKILGFRWISVTIVKAWWYTKQHELRVPIWYTKTKNKCSVLTFYMH